MAARYAEVSITESYPFYFLARKPKVKQELDFETEGYRTSNVHFTTRKLQFAIRAASDPASGPAIFLTELYVNCRMQL